jgi:acyl-[acyl-carrier-protein]-phospholipid O-acyltransferase / long-chain-fatty-acid--[acyl-carrier-protein] ligase
MAATSKDPLRGLLVAQFAGAFNNNALKWFAALLAVEAVAAGRDLTPAARETLQQEQETLAFVVFTLPFVPVSLPAGFFADCFRKRAVLLAMKAVEAALLAGVTLCLFLRPAGGVQLLVLLGLLGLQSAVFSPAMYGSLPEILPHERLSAGNGLVSMTTLVAIIAGTGVGSFLADRTAGGATWLGGALLVAVAVTGFLGARSLPSIPPAGVPGTLGDTVRGGWRVIRGDRVLWLTVLGQIFYWTIASLVGQDIPVYVRGRLDAADPNANLKASVSLTVLAVGVAAGSVLAGRLSAAKVELGLIPLGATGMSLFLLLLGACGPGPGGTLFLMALLGLSSGLVLVPLNAILQWRAPADRRGTVIALTNALTFAGIITGSLVGYGLSRAEVSARGILVCAGLLTFAGTAWAVTLLPEAFLRLVLVLLTHTFYRLRVHGREHVPQEGGALLTPNHVTFVDGLLLISSLDRPIRFLVDAGYFERWLYRPFLKALGAIPISSAGGPRVILRALRDAGSYLDRGELVCIFPEGQLTRTGMIQPFRRGLERIVKGRTAPVIPVYMDRIWGSVFSASGGRFLWKLPERIPYPVTVCFGTPLPAGTPVADIRRAVQELSATAWSFRKADQRPLHRDFIRQARWGQSRFGMADVTRPRLNRFHVLASAVVLARALRARWEGQQYVGILLSPSVAGALVNLAATLAGRTSVNLNFTAGPAGMGSAVRQAGLRTVVTSRAFLERTKVPLPEGVEPVWLEDLLPTIGRGASLAGFLLALFAPARLLEKACGATRAPTVDDIATVIFSSGSTGEPKGVLLSHFNVNSNVQAVSQVFRLEPQDRLLAILPLFHSFGYLSMWFGVTQRLGLVFHPSPLDAGVIGELVQRYRATILLATPTFLQIYLRRCTPAQFGSLRIVLAGAERLSERLAQTFEDTFGVRPLEGYGSTECAPVIAASTLDYRAPGFFQPGSRRGYVGQPLPGVAVRIVDPEMFELLPPDTPGMILVKGPNVMSGYLGREDLTRKVMRDGWYITGDMGLMDEDGFLRITDRLSRFSKIGGEMVPHGRVEEALQEAAGANVQVFAVTAVPDEKKGERLAVLHTLEEDKIPAILERVAAGGLPNLFVPRRDQFVRVDQLPLLGTGKLDLREVKRIATERLAAGARG